VSCRELVRQFLNTPEAKEGAAQPPLQPNYAACREAALHSPPGVNVLDSIWYDSSNPRVSVRIADYTSIHTHCGRGIIYRGGADQGCGVSRIPRGAPGTLAVAVIVTGYAEFTRPVGTQNLYQSHVRRHHLRCLQRGDVTEPREQAPSRAEYRPFLIRREECAILASMRRYLFLY
jgi:hypothetical protein